MKTYKVWQTKDSNFTTVYPCEEYAARVEALGPKEAAIRVVSSNRTLRSDLEFALSGAADSVGMELRVRDVETGVLYSANITGSFELSIAGWDEETYEIEGE